MCEWSLIECNGGEVFLCGAEYTFSGENFKSIQQIPLNTLYVFNTGLDIVTHTLPSKEIKFSWADGRHI